MRWFIEHIDVLVPVIAFVIYMLTRARGGEEEPAVSPEDYEAEERTRRIQEEIRRKIAERQGGGGFEGAGEEGPPQIEPAWRRLQEEGVPPPLVVEAAPPPMMEPVRDLYAELRAAESQRAESARRAAVMTRGLVKPKAPSRDWTPRARGVGASTGLAAVLREPASVRQAVLLREVLGPPKAVEDGATWP